MKTFLEILLKFVEKCREPLYTFLSIFLWKCCCSSHEHRSSSSRPDVFAIPVNAGRPGRFCTHIARRRLNLNQFNYHLYDRRFFRARDILRVPLPRPLAHFKKRKKVNIIFESFYRALTLGARVSRLYCAPGLGYVVSGTRAAPRWRECSPRMRFSPQFVSMENFTACVVSASAPVVSGGVFQRPAPERISTDPIRQFRCSRGSRHVCGSFPHGQPPPILFLTHPSGNSGVNARCRHLIRPAIPGHAPVAII